MRVKTMVTGPLQGNACLAWQEGARCGVLIDPGDEPARLQEEITAEGLTLGAILLTHAHHDHVGAAEELRRWSGAAICLSEQERVVLGWLPEASHYFGLPDAPTPQVSHWLQPSQIDLTQVLSPEQLGGLPIKVHATPGHSPGGVCYQMEDHWFVGDTLFLGSVGRVDLPGGDWVVLEESLRLLMRLPDDTVIHPGHGPDTTIGREKRTNPFLLEIEPRETAHA